MAAFRSDIDHRRHLSQRVRGAGRVDERGRDPADQRRRVRAALPRARQAAQGGAAGARGAFARGAPRRRPRCQSSASKPLRRAGEARAADCSTQGAARYRQDRLAGRRQPGWDRQSVRLRDDDGATFEYELVGPLESDVGNAVSPSEQRSDRRSGTFSTWSAWGSRGSGDLPRGKNVRCGVARPCDGL